LKPYFGPCTPQAHSAVHTQEYSYESAKRHYLSRMRRGAVRGSAQLSSLKSAHELPPPTVHGVVQVRVILWSPTAGRYEKRNVTAIFRSGGSAQTGSKSYPKPHTNPTLGKINKPRTPTSRPQKTPELRPAVSSIAWSLPLVLCSPPRLPKSAPARKSPPRRTCSAPTPCRAP
jgi:hypothetical protein